MRQIDQDGVVGHPSPRQIEVPDPRLAPTDQLEKGRIALAIKPARARKLRSQFLDFRFVEQLVFPFCRKLERPLLAIELLELADQLFPKLDQVLDIGMRILDELLRQR